MAFTEENYQAIVERVEDSELERLLKFDMKIKYRNIRQGNNYSDQVFNLMGYLERRSQVDEFLDHLVARRPDLMDVVSVSLDTPLRALEGAIRGRPDPIDLGTLYKKMSEFERSLCSISFPVEGGVKYGTGWLIGPDTIITNRHVLADVLDGPVNHGDVSCKFDFRTNHNGDVVNQGTIVKLSSEENWCLAERPHADEDLDPGTPSPPLDKLDFAVARLAEPIGENTIRSGSERRGWMDISSITDIPVEGKDVIIFQHPNGKPIQVAFGTVNEVTENKSRVRYDAVTDGGSSGSPVVDFNFNLTALHHAGDPLSLIHI